MDNDDGIRLLLTKDNMNNQVPFKIFKSESKGKIIKQDSHSHEYIQMWYVLSGRCTHYIGGGAFEYIRFGLFIVPPYTPHAVNTESEDTVLICCEFSERFINESLSRSDRDSFFDYAYLEPFFLYENIPNKDFRISRDKELMVESLILETLDNYEHQKKYSLLFIKANLLKLLAIIASEYERDLADEKNRLIEKNRPEIDSAIRYMEENYASKLYLEDVCRTSHMSHSTFSYIFKQVTDKTFSEYVINLRISKACELLKTTNSTVTEICQSCGFGDSTYFGRVFKKLIGVQPIQYRKQSRFNRENNTEIH